MVDKIRILFVDDEPHLLNGLRRSLAAMQDEWEMVFCGSGQEALSLMEKQQFDVIVSDMRMPQMDGATLLDHVRKAYPATVRIILSGYADTESVLRTVGPAHAYMAKPCDLPTLREAIRRPMALRRLLLSEGLRNVLAGLTTLPSLPDAYLAIQAELQSPHASAKVVAQIIGKDMAMTAEVLKLTNSAYFTVGARVTTPLQAVRMLGLETIQALVLRIGIFRQFSGNPDMTPMLGALTEHSLAIARLAEAVAAAEGAETALAKAAYGAGMLSFIGNLVLLDAHRTEYRRVLARVGPQMPLHVAESEAFGASHALIGAYLMGLWGFSDTLVEAIAYSCEPSACAGRDNLLLTATHTARALGPALPLLDSGIRDFSGMDMAYLKEARKEGRVAVWRQMMTELGR